MPQSLKLQVANVVVRFGDEVLLDRADQLVLPSFLSGYVRKYGQTKYFFQDIGFMSTAVEGHEDFAVYGRLIKDTVLVRDQVYKNGKLISDHGELESAPSSIFVFLLRNHRLLLMQETRFAPTATQFGATLKHCINSLRQEVINTEYDSHREAELKISKARLQKKFPRASVSVLPVGTLDNLEEFIGRFNRVDLLQIKLVPVNEEPDLSAFHSVFRQNTEALEAKRAKIEYKADPQGKGLDKAEVIEQVTSSLQGTSDIVVSGIDEQGEVLRGNTGNFKVEVPLESVSEDPRDASMNAIVKFNDMLRRGLLRYGGVNKKAKAAVSFLKSRWLGDE